jgi:hypothetical protein
VVFVTIERRNGMANTTVNASNLTYLRGNNHVIHGVYLNTVTLETVATLTITNAGDVTPLPEVTVSGDSSDVVQGQMVRIFDGSDLIATTIVRKAPSGNTFYLAPVSSGDGGYPSNIEDVIATGQTLVVYTHRPLWAHYSSIRQRVFYKSWDVVYSDQNSQPPPIANTGTWQHGVLDGSSTASFTLPRNGIQNSFALHGGSLTYSWDLPTGVTLKAGYALSDGVIEVDAIQGQHLVSLTVTDDNTKTHTAYMWLFVTDGDSTGETYPFKIDSDSQDRQGREIRLTVWGESLQDVFYQGAPILLNEDATYNGQALSIGVGVDTFLGYITSIEYTYEDGVSKASITAMSPMKAVNNMPTPPQLLVEASSPANWTECTTVLSNPMGATYYALRWAIPAIFEMHDFDPYDSGSLLNSPRKLSIEYSVDNIYDAGKRGADFIVGNLGSSSDGATVLRKHPSYRGNSYRNALDTIIALGADDVQSPLSYARMQYSPVSELRGGGFAYDGTSIKAWMGIKRWYQGVSKETISDFIVTVDEGLQGVKEIVGHALAKKNAEIPEIGLTLVGNIDVLEPVWLDAWVTLNLDSSYDPYGDGFSFTRTSVMRIERTWDISDTITKTILVTLEPETFGQPAEQFIIGNPNALLGANGWIASQAVPYVNEQSELYSVYISGNTDGESAITFNFSDVSPTYDQLLPTPTGEVANICLDYGSPYFDGNNVEGDLYLYMAVIEGDEIDIYRVSDVLTAPSYTLLTSENADDSTIQATGVQIRCSESNPDIVICTYHDQTGVHYIRSTNGGDTWATATIGSTTTDTSNDDAPTALAVQGTYQYATGWDSSSSSYRVYRADGSGSFSLMNNSSESSSPYPLLYADDTYLYATSINTSTLTPDIQEDFDGGATASLFSDMQSDGSITGNEVFKNISETKTGNGGGNAGGVQFNASSDQNDLTIEEVYARVLLSGSPLNNKTLEDGQFDYAWDATDLTINVATVAETDVTITIEVLIAQANNLNYPATASYSNIVHRETIYTLNYTKPAGANSFTWALPAQDWVTFAFEGTAQTLPAVNGNRMGVWLVFSGTSTSGTLVVSVPASETDNWIYFDNVQFGTIAGASPTLHRVSDPDGSDSWTDITPATDFVPRLPYALVSDIVDSDSIECFASDGSATRFYRSTDAGDSWSNEGTTDYRYAKRAGDIFIAGGDDVLDLSVDNATTVENRKGNLDAVLNPIGTHYYGIIII